MTHRIIDTPHELAELATFLGSLKLPITVEWQQGRDRSLEQNHLQFLWANEAAQQFGDRTVGEVRADWKLRHGVPILRGDDAQFRQTYDEAIKPLPFERKLKAMEYFPVTSLMKVRQMVQYLDTVQRECLENGLRLTDPTDDLAKYQNRYRAKAA